MKKVIIQSLISIVTFCAVWWGISQVNWLSVFHLEETVMEEKIGEFYWDLYSEQLIFSRNKEYTNRVESQLGLLCQANDIPVDDISIHVVKSEEVNAFAFPGRHIVVNTALIEACEHDDELCGVIAHELAHIQERHVMKKVTKEMTITALTIAISNGQGSELLAELVQVLSSTAYDRTYEREADATAVRYLHHADVDPMALADFLVRISSDNEIPQFGEWISTHPDSEKRREEIKKLSEKYK